MPLARRRLRQLVGHLVVDAHDPALAEHLDRARRDGFRLNMNLLGEAVLGEAEAAGRAARTTALLERHDVDYVSIKVSALVSQISTWDTAATVERVLGRLRPLYRAAMAKRPHAFVNLDMEEYRDLDLTLEVFTALLAEPEFHELEAGIVLQAYLPDSVAALDRLIEFAAAAGRGGWCRHQGPTRQGRQPVDGAASTPSSTVGWRRPMAARPRSTPTTCASSIGRSAPSSPACCASASPPTTCTTSRSRTCSPSAAACRRRSTSRCSRGCRRPRRGP